MDKRGHYLTIVLGIVALVLFRGCHTEGPPYSPSEALEMFQLPPGFRIELVAAEPKVVSPVDLAFDTDGRLYVAEMPDYPAGGGQSVTGRIRLLEDRDGDGRFEKSTVFADDLPFVNGVMPWKNGVLVTAAPDIIYFKDTDGDGRADVHRVVLTGFAVTNPQLRMSNPEYGMDNWIYGAYSRAGGSRRYPQFADQGSPLTFPDDPEIDSVDIYPGTDFRFRPAEYIVEPAGGMSEFGNAFDAAGNRFTIWNNKHLRHVVIPHRYVTRNPYLSVPSVMAFIPDHGPAATLYPITENPQHLHESEIGHFTAACGTSIYTADKFPDKYRGNAFVCAPVHNLVHSDVLKPSGATFTASRPREGEAFLASTDRWFHPVNTMVGPDGALYVADFYRKLVEHPTFIAHADSQGLYTYSGVLTKEDFRKGSGKGRIYRVVPEGFQAGEKPNLREASIEELVDYLSHPNRWWRITAQRLLVVDRQDPAAVPLLEEMVRQSQSPEARMHALWTLEGLQALRPEIIRKALEDESPRVRKQAIRLAELHLENPSIREKLLQMGGDPNDHVQFQLVLTLGFLPSDESFGVLKQVAFRHVDDPWFRTAALTSAPENALQWYNAVVNYLKKGTQELEGRAAFLQQIASIIGARQIEEEVAKLLAVVRRNQDQGKRQGWIASLEGLAEGLDRGRRPTMDLSRREQTDLVQLIESSSGDLQHAALDVAERVTLAPTNQLRAMVQRAVDVALDEEVSIEQRVNAIRILGLDPKHSTIEQLGQLLSPRHQEEIRVAAAGVLVEMGDADALPALLAAWETYTVPVREVVESGFMSRTRWRQALLQAVEKGELAPSLISRSHRRQLLQSPNEDISQQAHKLFADVSVQDREEVIEEYYSAIQVEGGFDEGRRIYEEQCATCHKIGDTGFEVGPNLVSLTNRTKIDLMTQILDPNDNISPGYEAYIVETTGGEVVRGVMVNEAASSVLLRSAGGTEERILRSNIEAIRPSPVSLMPARLENSISKREMADLLTYLQNLK